MTDHLRSLMAHLRWADDRVRESLERAADAPPKALELYAHVVAAEHVWLSRLRGDTPRVPVWPALTLPESAALARETADGLEALVGRLSDADASSAVTYRNSAGAEFTSSVGDILLHVAMHGSYHRGQIALLLRGAGHEPASTDFIAFVRGAPAATRQR
jgi:uncharacterized damage-inducible protein DinB